MERCECALHQQPPVKPLNVSSQATEAPVAEALTVAVNVPRAAATSPVGPGTSCEAFNTVASLMAVALPAPFAPPATTSVRPSTTAAAPEATDFFLRAPFLRKSSSNASL